MKTITNNSLMLQIGSLTLLSLLGSDKNITFKSLTRPPQHHMKVILNSFHLMVTREEQYYRKVLPSSSYGHINEDFM